MPVVWSARHRGHAPHGGYWLGVHEPGDEEPERGDLLRDGMAAAGAPIVEAPDLGLDPILAVHDPAFVDFMSRAYPAWVAEGHLESPGQPNVTGYLFANPGFAARYTGRRPATIRAELGLYAMDTMTLLSEGTFDAACAAVHAAAHAADLVATGARAAYAAVGRRATTRAPRSSAARATSTMRPQRPSGWVAGLERVAIVDIDAHQGNGTQEIFWDRADVLYTSVHVDPAEGWFPAYRRPRRRARRRRGRGLQPQRAGFPAGAATTRGSRVSIACSRACASTTRARSSSRWASTARSTTQRLRCGSRGRASPPPARASAPSASRPSSSRKAATTCRALWTSCSPCSPVRNAGSPVVSCAPS